MQTKTTVIFWQRTEHKCGGFSASPFNALVRAMQEAMPLSCMRRGQGRGLPGPAPRSAKQESGAPQHSALSRCQPVGRATRPGCSSLTCSRWQPPEPLCPLPATGLPLSACSLPIANCNFSVEDLGSAHCQLLICLLLPWSLPIANCKSAHCLPSAKSQASLPSIAHLLAFCNLQALCAHAAHCASVCIEHTECLPPAGTHWQSLSLQSLASPIKTGPSIWHHQSHSSSRSSLLAVGSRFWKM